MNIGMLRDISGWRAALPAALLLAGLNGCAKPPAPVAEAPPAPVGHVYPTIVAVPDAPPRIARRITQEQARETQQAFNVIALKSALMVGALSCDQQSQYDAFMTEYQPHVLDEQHVMDAYFKRIGGYAGRAQEDNFVTLLANNQSVTGIAQGAVFCLNNTAEFQQVMAFKSPDDLDRFVTDNTPDGPVAAAVAAPAPVVTARHHSVHVVKKPAVAASATPAKKVSVAEQAAQ